MDREPEGSETSASGPFLNGRGRNGAVFGLVSAKERFRVESAQGEQVIEGIERAV